ncbi:hypothetical protein [Antribacter gilvus]|uniref:hypothetical protein n=1 Tax=Antribacter gilvus TaxID=2304675 RepID=UPI000F7739B6|nr:hypothetical protein [Antribacter gilvus]
MDRAHVRWCAACGAALPPEATARRRYCGAACDARAYRRRRKLDRIARAAVAALTDQADPGTRITRRVCPGCGNGFIAGGGGHRADAVCCSPRCRQRKHRTHTAVR